MKEAIRFGKYLLIERINVGGMAEVFKAKTFGVEGFEKLVAIKRILPSIAEDDEFIKMFIDEAKITVKLQHANIAQVYELGKIEDSYFIAMEFINGKDLKQLFEYYKKKGEPMDIAQACYITSQLCSGLDYAHRKKDERGNDLNIIHRDVSPQNVRISYDGEVKVIDFGIAKAKNKSSKTEAGILKGKFGYMSPEQVRGKTIDRRSDIFAIGIIFYELLTGTRLFQGETDFSTLEKIRNVDIELPTKRNPNIPKELEKIVMKALEADRKKRYSYAHDMHDDLQKFMILNNYMYSRTDLANWMKKTYKKDIEKDLRLLKQYENYDNSGFNNNSNNTVQAKAPTNEVMDWDDDEMETQIYDKSPSFVGESPKDEADINKSKINKLPKKNLAQEIKEKKQKQKRKKLLMMFAAFAILLLLAGVLYTQLFQESGIEQKAYLDYEMNIDLNVTPPNNFNIYIDGNLIRKNENSPYLVKNIKPGTHVIKIEKKGYEPAEQTIRLPKLTKKDKEDLQLMQNSLAVKKYGLTYDQYIAGIMTATFRLKEKSLEKLTINVKPEDAQIFFDEKLVSDKSPAVLNNLKKGKYKIKIVKKGYKTKIQTLTIKDTDLSLKNKELNIELEQGKQIEVEIKTLKNTTLYIDNEKIQGSTPYKLKLTEGKHTFKVKGPYHKTLVKELNVKEKNKTFTLKPIQAYVELTIDSKPQGAKVYLHDRDNLKSALQTPTPVTEKVEIKNLTAITLEKSGYKKTSVKFKWNKKLKQKVMIILNKEGQPVKIVRSKKTASSNTSSSKPKARKYGYISIISRPATSIKVDGKNLGRKTPLIKFKIPAGKHRITLYNRAKKIKDSFTITILPNKVKPIIKKY